MVGVRIAHTTYCVEIVILGAPNEGVLMNKEMPSQRPSPKRIPVSIRIRSDLITKAKALARDLAGKPLYLSLSSLTESALEREIARIERLMGEPDDESPTPLGGTAGTTDRGRVVNNVGRIERRTR